MGELRKYVIHSKNRSVKGNTQTYDSHEPCFHALNNKLSPAEDEKQRK